jgi:putative oxidoreductase
MDVVFLIGRICFAFIFVMSGVSHFARRIQMVDYARAYDAPFPELAVPATGAMILAGGALIALGAFADVGALLVIAFLPPSAWFFHGYWREGDPHQRATQMAHFNKNVTMLGGAIVLFWLYNQLQGDAPLSLTNPLFNPF